MSLLKLPVNKMADNIPAISYKTLDEKDLRLVHLIRESKMLNKDIDTPKVKYWNCFGNLLRLSPGECRRRWNSILMSYLNLKEAISQGAKINSPLLNGLLDFLDESKLYSYKDYQIDLATMFKNQQQVTNYTVTLEMIEDILKDRNDCNSYIDPDDVEVNKMLHMVNNRLREVLYFSEHSTTTKAMTENVKQIQPSTMLKNDDLVMCTELTNTDNDSSALLNNDTNNWTIFMNSTDQTDTRELLSCSKIEASHAVCVKSTMSANNMRSIPTYKVDKKEGSQDSRLLVHNCNNRNTKDFFKELGDYVYRNISEKKQMELRLKICSLVSAELNL
ncbi:uncharacterized protein LOC131847281 isoform X2 [Achroia grisella]|uniref:uncharacterized protein LOC131847281 isoform X2 n=1 Tax=Achroia grisella TaxID=688607 RepID=UPI0027D338CA|nr:uncharacterized protein LOC131847281 isoform X2 [Achroia grisella]